MKRAGMTMIELIVVLAILGLVSGMVGVAFVDHRGPQAPSDALAAQAMIARRSAIRRGVPVTVELRDTGTAGAAIAAPRRLTALPDGSIIGDSTLRVDRLSGRAGTGSAPHAAR